MLQLFQILRDRGSISQQEFDLLNNLTSNGPTTAATNSPPSATPTTPAGDTATVEEKVQQTQKSVEALDQKVDAATKRLFALEEITDGTSSELVNKALADKWYQRFSFGGYTQLRYTSLLDKDAESLVVPNDRSVSETDSLFIRRGRFKLSGDVTPHLYLYSQVDFSGSVGGRGDFGLQARDLYADFSFDKSQEYRLRAGLSKVQFGWVNMQSSQNRAPMERPDAINSAAEGERDLGAYFM